MRTINYLLLLVSLSYFPTSLTAQDSQFNELFKSLDSANFNLKIGLNPGVYYKKLSNRSLFLEIIKGTSAIGKIRMSGGKIVYLNYQFSQPVILSDIGNEHCDGLYIKSILFQNDFLSIDSFSVSKKKYCKASDLKNIKALRNNLAKPDSINKVLRGSLFKSESMTEWDSCTSNFNNCKSIKNIVESVSLETPDGYIRFKKDFKFLIGDQTNYSNYIITGDSDFVKFSQLDVITDPLSCEINATGTFSTLREANLESQGCKFKLGSPNFSDLQIRLSSKIGITRLSGNIKAITNDAFIESMGANTSCFFIGNGSEINFQNFELVNLPENCVHLKIGMGSTISMNIDSAELTVNELTSLRLINSKIRTLQIFGEFFSEKKTNYIQASAFDVTFNLRDSKIAVNPYSTLFITAGNFHARSLEMNTTLYPFVRGQFDVWDLTIKPGTILAGSKDGFAFQLSEGSKISQDPKDPIRFEKDEPYPLGTIVCNLSFSQFLANSQKQFRLTSGILRGNLSYLGNEQFVGANLNLEGDLNTIVNFNVQTPVSTRFKISEGRLTFSKQMLPDFTGSASFQLNPITNPLVIQTPCFDDDQLDWQGLKDEHLYPLKLNIYIDHPVVFRRFKIAFKNDIIQGFSGESSPTSLTLETPAGYGEYDPDHDDCNEISTNTNNQDRGDDDIKDKQEIGRASTGVVPSCTIHAWLKIARYPVPYSINFEYKISPISKLPTIVFFPKINTTDLKLEYIRHGCDDIVRETIGSFFLNIDDLLTKKIQDAIDKVAARISQGITIPIPRY
ncbi:hypothetical protein A3860_34190 [Niastella vici]|uniref:AsmA-like C-terminal domain-containing protein n=1 Tax=Niastella vici TaxID=1703345 RepID=A0A1V9FP67_9BACT|nr:hypothetical protein [Niastella vici]OQP60132.1 hypothetical protein A3860_34190 [Niastella vici]